MYFDRFDIVEAWYLALAHCHGGQWSDEYRRLCWIISPDGLDFRPRPNLDTDTLTDNGREIYNAAVKTLLK